MTLSAKPRGDLLILLAAFIWGVAFYFQKVAMLQLGPLSFLGMRGLVAGLTLLPFVMVEQQRHRRRQLQGLEKPGTDGVVPSSGLADVLPLGLLAGCVFFVAGALQQSGLVTATVTNTGFLTALYVVVTPLLFWLVRRRTPGRIVWLSVALAFLGVWGLSGGSLDSFTRGDVLVACSSLFWASLIIVGGESGRHAQPLTYTCIQFLVVAVLGLGSASVLEVIDMDRLRAALIPILYVGVLSSAFTFGLMAIALQYVPAPRASVLLSTETLFAAMAGYLWLGERLSGLAWTGAGLIVLSVWIVQKDRR